jgi:hypothetical protein
MGRMVDGMHDHRSIQYGPTLYRLYGQGLLTLLSQAFALGIACRFALHAKPESHGIYIAEYFFVVLSVRRAFQPFL